MFFVRLCQSWRLPEGDAAWHATGPSRTSSSAAHLVPEIWHLDKLVATSAGLECARSSAKLHSIRAYTVPHTRCRLPAATKMHPRCSSEKSRAQLCKPLHTVDTHLCLTLDSE